MYGIIYKITNQINGKVYIGQTCKTLKHRFNQHCESSRRYNRNKKHLCLFHTAIIKYGEDNFICEEIDIADSKIELNEKEKYWISFYKSNIYEFGYNLTEGGDGGPTTNNCRWYNDGVKNYYIHINDEVSPNLKKGRLMNIDNKGKIWINNGEEQYHISKDDLDKYEGFQLGMLNRGDDWYCKVSSALKNKSEETKKRISESKKTFHKENPDFRNKGNWVEGQVAHNKGLISITNGVKNKYIREDELSYYQGLGWYKGNIQHHKKRKSEV